MRVFCQKKKKKKIIANRNQGVLFSNRVDIWCVIWNSKLSIVAPLPLWFWASPSPQIVLHFTNPFPWIFHFDPLTPRKPVKLERVCQSLPSASRGSSVHITSPPGMFYGFCQGVSCFLKTIIDKYWNPGAAEATGLGVVCFVVSTLVCCQPTELILGGGGFEIKIFQFLLPPPPHSSFSFIPDISDPLRGLGVHLLGSLVQVEGIVTKCEGWGNSLRTGGYRSKNKKQN